jgi:hypothetical protein
MAEVRVSYPMLVRALGGADVMPVDGLAFHVTPVGRNFELEVDEDDPVRITWAAMNSTDRTQIAVSLSLILSLDTKKGCN